MNSSIGLLGVFWSHLSFKTLAPHLFTPFVFSFFSLLSGRVSSSQCHLASHLFCFSKNQPLLSSATEDFFSGILALQNGINIGFGAERERSNLSLLFVLCFALLFALVAEEVFLS
jgi:hypothetical protein